MTDIPAEVPADQVTERPEVSRVLLTVFLALFLALGWLPGRALLLLLADAAVAVRLGYRRGRGLPPPPAERPPGG